MAQRLKVRRDQKIEIQLNELEREYVTRVAYEMNMSRGEWFRGWLPTTEKMREAIKNMRRTQNGRR